MRASVPNLIPRFEPESLYPITHLILKVRKHSCLLGFAVKSRALKSFPPVRVLAFCLFLVTAPNPSRAFLLEGPAWPAGSHVVIKLGLGPTSVSLQDGLGSWNASAADALALWNGYLDFIHISSVSSPTVPQRSGDHINAVFFSNTVFGESFDSGTLAVTVYRFILIACDDGGGCDRQFRLSI